MLVTVVHSARLIMGVAFGMLLHAAALSHNFQKTQVISSVGTAITQRQLTWYFQASLKIILRTHTLHVWEEIVK